MTGVPGGRICSCQAGYSGNGEGLNGCVQSGGGGGSQDRITCNDIPCINGRCVSQGQYAYECECDLGWEGVNCDQETQECNSNPCRNDGTCIEEDNGPGYTCSCTSGFGGVNCEEELYGRFYSAPSWLEAIVVKTEELKEAFTRTTVPLTVR